MSYSRKLTLHEIKILNINVPSIDANVMGDDFQIKEITAKEKRKIGNYYRNVHRETKFAEIIGTKSNV